MVYELNVIGGIFESNRKEDGPSIAVFENVDDAMKYVKGTIKKGKGK